MAGAGAAGTGALKLLLLAGATNVVAWTRGGRLPGPPDMNDNLTWIAGHTNAEGYAGDLAGAVEGADVFIGMSARNILSGEDVKTMNSDAIVFALANPDPEVDPEDCPRARGRRGDRPQRLPQPDQQRPGLPGVFRGLLDAQSKMIDDRMLAAAARALADVVQPGELGPDYIIPSVFHPEVASRVAAAIREIAGQGDKGTLEDARADEDADIDRPAPFGGA